jgi:hypothetical protein
MATTTNYSWTTPDDTALVKDGAAAIRTLGSSIDTTTKNLNPSTTLGDIEYRSSTANTNTRLGIGTTGQVLTVAGGVPSWATPAGSAFVGCRITQAVGGNQSIANSTFTDITFDDETYDTDAFHDNVTNNARITIPSGKGGKYQLNGHVEFGASNTTGTRNIRILKNNTDTITITRMPSPNGDCNTEVNTVAILNAGDYITLQVFQTSGGNVDVYKRTDTTYLSVTYLGA